MKNVTIKKVKKAFTLVELLVVIAILAILGTVGVVGYTAFINKANQSNDQTVISELNTFVKAADTLESIDTVSDANDALIEEGFNLKTLKTTTKGYSYGYDVVNKEFCLIDKEWNLVNYSSSNKENIFAFVDDTSDLTQADDDSYSAHGYSIFLQKNFTWDSDTIKINKGIDVGSNTTLKNFNYVNNGDAQTSLIRTNSVDATITIDAPKDTVNHYDVVLDVTITRIAAKSYHEFGTCAYVECSSGRVVADQGGVIDTVVLTETEESTKASVLTGIGTINKIYACSSAVITANNNEANEHDTLDNVIVLETTESHTLENAKQDAKDAAKETTLENVQSSCDHNFDNGSCTICGKKDSSWLEDIENSSVQDLVAENNVYSIKTATDLAVFSRMVNADKIDFDNNITVNLLDSISMQNKLFEPISSFKGTFNGNNNTISNLNINVTDTDKSAGLFGSLNNATTSNLTIKDSTITKNGSYVGALAGSVASGSITNVNILNCTVNGTSDYTGGLVGQGYSYITNCTVKACNITGKEQTGGIIGYMWVGSLNNNNVESCNIESTGDRAGGLIGKFQCDSGNVGNSTMHVDGNKVSKTKVTAPDVCGGLIGQVMGDLSCFTIKNNSINAYLDCDTSKKNLLWNLRDGQNNTFVNALSNEENVSGNTTSEYTPSN